MDIHCPSLYVFVCLNFFYNKREFIIKTKKPTPIILGGRSCNTECPFFFPVPEKTEKDFKGRWTSSLEGRGGRRRERRVTVLRAVWSEGAIRVERTMTWVFHLRPFMFLKYISLLYGTQLFSKLCYTQDYL